MPGYRYRATDAGEGRGRVSGRAVVAVPAPRTAAPPLDDEQAAVVAAEVGSQLVLGPAGSGKTTVLLEALCTRLDAGWDPEQMLGLVPGQAEARRWRAAVAARTGRRSPPVTTLHALALRRISDRAAAEGREPPRLLAAGDQLEVVADVVADSRREWPRELAEAIGTRAFAESVRDFLNRAAANGWTPDRLAAASRAPVAGSQALWLPLSAVWRRYLDVLALSDAMDYPALLQRAANAWAEGARRPWALVCVEGYGALDQLQIALLRRLVPQQGRLVAVTDPDQVVDRFRGASQHAVTSFDRWFPGPSPPAVLTGSYRFGDDAEAVRQRVSARLPLAGLPGEAVRAHRSARRAAGRSTQVGLTTFPDELAEALGVAEELRRHATGGLASGAGLRWSDAAVLVRTSAQARFLEDVLTAAGIPTAVLAPGGRLSDEPVVRLLTTALRLAAQVAGLETPGPDASLVRDLLVSPMAGADPVQLRRLLILLRRREVAEAKADGRRPRSSQDLLLACLTAPEGVPLEDERRYPAVLAVDRLRRRLGKAAQAVQRGDVAETLWVLWSDAPNGPGSWAQRLQRAALDGGPDAAAAHRDLDAAVALFAVASRSTARGGQAGIVDFLAALPTMSPPGDRFGGDAGVRNAVSLLTVHRALGGQWGFVVVPGVQEGIWPREGGGPGLLGDELLEDPQAAGVGLREEQLADERRLFNLACTRASDRLLITAVAAAEHDPAGPRPSRLLADLGLSPGVGLAAAGGRLTAGGLVAELRRAAADPEQPALATAASARLGALSGDRDFPGADPEDWWASAEWTKAPLPLIPPEEPVPLSVTGLAELSECPRRWLLTRQLGVSAPVNAAAGVGRLVHRVHEAWSVGDLPRQLGPAEELLDEAWAALPFEADWQARRRRREVTEALLRLLSWQHANADRILFAEHAFELRLDLPDGDALRLRGKADVGLRSGASDVAILDVKTAKSAPTRAQVAHHVQLGGYQAATETGTWHGEAGRSAGAGLLMASVPDGAASEAPKVLWQPPLALSDPEGSQWFVRTASQAAARVRAEHFPAIESSSCRTCPVRGLCPAKHPDLEVAP